MKYMTKFLTNFFLQDSVKPLGRWNIEYCSTKLNRKIDLSNEDHCGPCGQYDVTEITKKEMQNKIILLPSKKF